MVPKRFKTVESTSHYRVLGLAVIISAGFMAVWSSQDRAKLCAPVRVLSDGHSSPCPDSNLSLATKFLGPYIQSSNIHSPWSSFLYSYTYYIYIYVYTDLHRECMGADNNSLCQLPLQPCCAERARARQLRLHPLVANGGAAPMEPLWCRLVARMHI